MVDYIFVKEPLRQYRAAGCPACGKISSKILSIWIQLLAGFATG